MNDWPTYLVQWIGDHPDHILHKAVQLRYRESLEATKIIDEEEIHLKSPLLFAHALEAVSNMMLYYRRIHKMKDFEEAAEQTFRVYAERRLKGNKIFTQAQPLPKVI